ncbi:MAG: carboxylesterase family protein [Pseudonocardia sp.]|nr:carboxylesterase family protein [Pseudonocardia sp.]
MVTISVPPEVRRTQDVSVRRASERASSPAVAGAAVSRTSQRVVLVWLHGGGYSSGGGAPDWYDGSTLACEGDVVVVGVNYRLGPLDYLRVEGAGNGDAGLLDMIEALRWVRDNIAAFGCVAPPFLPVLDGLGLLVSEAAHGAVAAGVPVIVGTTRDEARSMVTQVPTRDQVRHLTRRGWRAAPTPTVVLVDAMTDTAFTVPAPSTSSATPCSCRPPTPRVPWCRSPPERTGDRPPRCGHLILLPIGLMVCIKPGSRHGQLPASTGSNQSVSRSGLSR